jgi:hypothetical protein
MGTYVLGTAALFAIGFITYELYEGIQSGFAAAKEELAAPIETYNAYEPQVQSAGEDATIAALAGNPITAPIALGYAVYENL